MVNLCQKFISTRNLRFGTNSCPEKSKTKCIVFSKKSKDDSSLKPITLDGNNLPWVSKVKHLGHVLQRDNSMTIDIAQKRGAFISRVNSLLQKFYFAPPKILMKLMHIYATCLYGSNIWDILSPKCEKLYTSYNVAVRSIFKLDRRTQHRYLVEPLSGYSHLKTLVAARYSTFYRSLVESTKFPVRFLASLQADDLRSVLGRNVASIATICDLTRTDKSRISASLVKRKMVYRKVEEENSWKVTLAAELLDMCSEDAPYVQGFSNVEIREMLDYLCTT